VSHLGIFFSPAPVVDLSERIWVARACVRALLSFDKNACFPDIFLLVLDFSLLTFKSDLGTVPGKAIRLDGTKVFFFLYLLCPLSPIL
jgi:hypothetical protein